jgi:ribose transport system substrate-binding protein
MNTGGPRCSSASTSSSSSAAAKKPMMIAYLSFAVNNSYDAPMLAAAQAVASPTARR